ncbi:hypothetical protein GOV11_01305 [Candidatus Woesearchaeota archaeon]|nr:hypothetical protein [Candidatus Woesearchaeota archaeon]
MRRFLLLLLILPQLALGATISGTVHDIEWIPSDAIVTVSTTPEQKIVALGGEYSFEVNPGTYLLRAESEIDGDLFFDEQEITIETDGIYNLDLILVPSFEDLEDLELEKQPEELDSLSGYLIAWTLFFIVLVIMFLVFFYTKKRTLKSEDDEFRAAVLTVLKKHKGRATQKELRKELPFSEAKASLVLTELESEGKIKKIKKGRGNIIILQK